MNIEDPDFPYDKKAQLEIKSFFDKIASKPKVKAKNYYKRSLENGNLEIYDKKTGELQSSIPLYYYRSLSKEEFDTLDKKRIDDIIAVEELIDIQKSLLHTAYDTYKSTKDSSDFMKINKEIKLLEIKKTLIKSPIRDIKYLASVETRKIDLDEPNEVRKKKDVQVSIYRDFPLWKLYGKYTDSKEILEASEQESIVLKTGELFLKNGKIARIFNDVDNENKDLSIFTLREFVYRDIKYSSPYQAFEALRLMELGFEELRNEVMKVRSTRLIKNIAKKINKSLNNIKLIWRDILLNFYQQNEDLLKALLATNNDILVFANSISYLGGIGYNAGMDEVLDPLVWKSIIVEISNGTKVLKTVIKPNIVGEVLMELRTEFRERPQIDLVKTGGNFSESSKTQEDEIKQKVGSIIHHMKKRNY